MDSLITSKTRIQILSRFFLNPQRKAYLRELAAEMGESTNAVRLELNRLAGTKLLRVENIGRTKCYQANTDHPLFPEIQSIVRKTLGIDKLVDEVIARLGEIRLALITGDYAGGIDGGIIDLVLVGPVDRVYLNQLVEKTEKLIDGRKIRCLCLREGEYEDLSDRLSREKIIVVYENKSSGVLL